MPNSFIFLILRGLSQFPSILQALQGRVVRLNNPDSNFPFGTSGDDLIEPPNQRVVESFFGNSGDDIIYGMGPDIIQGDSEIFRNHRISSNFSTVTYGDDTIFGDHGDKDSGHCQLNLPFLRFSNKLPSIAFDVSFRKLRLVV